MNSSAYEMWIISAQYRVLAVLFGGCMSRLFNLQSLINIIVVSFCMPSVSRVVCLLYMFEIQSVASLGLLYSSLEPVLYATVEFFCAVSWLLSLAVTANATHFIGMLQIEVRITSCALPDTSCL